MATHSDDLIREIQRLEGCERTKSRVIAMLRSYAGHSIYIAKSSVIRSAWIRSARRMLDDGYERSEVREALIERYGVCRTTAYRLINAALCSMNNGETMSGMHNDSAG